MSQTAKQIRLLAEVLDAKGDIDRPIVVVGTRANLLKHFRPEKRGDRLMCGQHELQLMGRSKPVALDNLDWVGVA